MMRREKKEKKEKLKSWGVFPLFWKKCECCESEIRFEWVWKFTKISTMCIPPFVTTHMICRECAETRQVADDFAVHFVKVENRMPEKPTPPPPPPPKRIIREDTKPIGPPNRVFKPCGTEWVRRG